MNFDCLIDSESRSDPINVVTRYLIINFLVKSLASFDSWE